MARRPTVPGLLNQLRGKPPRVATDQIFRTGSGGFAGGAGGVGPTGATGRDDGFRFTYLTDTALTDPGSGGVKFNSTTMASINNMRISETDADGNSLFNFLATIDDPTSTIKGYVLMRRVSNPATFALFSITGNITDHGTWDDIAIALVASAGSFANTDAVSLSFSRTGDQGATGNTGSQGIQGPAGVSLSTGDVYPTARRSALTGEALCDGSAISRTTFSALFNAIVPLIGTFTVTIASPAVVTLTAHGLVTGDAVYLTTTGALPTGLAQNTLYYVIRIDANTFNLATTRANADAGTKINTSGSQSGTHSLRFCPYGLGDGSTTFNVPDLRGRGPIGAGVGTGLTSRRLGEAGGEETHKLTTAEMPSHTHNTNANTGFSSGVVGGSTFTAPGATGSSGSAGGDGNHNTMQPFAVMNWMIKT